MGLKHFLIVGLLLLALNANVDARTPCPRGKVKNKFFHGKYSLLGCSWVHHEGRKICCRYFFPDGRCKAPCVPLGPQDHEVLIDEN